MSIRFECPNCKKEYKIPEKYLEKEVDCPNCKTTSICKDNKIPSSELTQIKAKKKGRGCAIILGGFFISIVFLVCLFSLRDCQGKDEIARADKLWMGKQRGEAVRIYIREMLYVGKSDKPEIYKRIITYRHDSGDAEGATEYCNKAIEENLDIHFTRNDLRRVLDNARQAIEERKAKKLAEEKAIKERRAGERAIRREESNALLQENLDTYLNALETMGVSTVRKIEVTQRGNIWTATLSVDNAWHLSPYQIRLQNAQTLWKTWAQIASPDKPDSARISIVDLNGNEVGGSRMLAGSLIWVQKN